MSIDLYHELIIDHGTNPRNFKKLIEPTHQAAGYNPLCGDQINLFLKLKEDQIQEICFQGQGCAISTASASIMSEILLNQTSAEALILFNEFTNYLTTQHSNQKAIPHNMDLMHTSSITSLTEFNFPDKLMALLGVKNYPSRVKCATLAWHALHNALTQQQDL